MKERGKIKRREPEEDKVIKHYWRCDTPLHVCEKIGDKEKDQEKLIKEKERLLNVPVDVEEMEGTWIMSAEEPVNSFGANEINIEKRLKPII